MKNYNYVSKIESFSCIDGPGIRTVVFFSGCNLRCKFCHNPEMFKMKKSNYSVRSLVKKILNNKSYFKNGGGVTFSGGEPLLHKDYLIKVIKKLKRKGIHIAIDTALYTKEDVTDLLKLVDLVILDIKHVEKDGYYNLTFGDIDIFNKNIKMLNGLDKKVWIRQVIIPGINDNKKYIKSLKNYLKQIKNIERVDFLPFHNMGFDKYEKLGIINYFKDVRPMDIKKCEELYPYFKEI